MPVHQRRPQHDAVPGRQHSQLQLAPPAHRGRRFDVGVLADLAVAGVADHAQPAGVEQPRGRAVERGEQVADGGSLGGDRRAGVVEVLPREGGVHDGIGVRRAGPQRVAVAERARQRLDAGRDQRRGAGRAAGQAGDGVPAPAKRPHDRGADEPRRAGDEDPHRGTSAGSPAGTAQAG
nr:hypothetical protein [Jiangella alkaliphila]